MNWNNTIRNPRSQAEVQLLPQMLQTWVVELSFLKKDLKVPRIERNSGGFIFSPLSPCVSVFVCLLACAVSAMLCEVVASGVSSSVKSGSVDGEKVKGDMDFDVVLCQSELIERALQLCHLLPPGFLPVGLNSYHSSHTQATTLCLTQWMLNRAEQPFILLCCPYLWKKEGSDLCVYFICACLCNGTKSTSSD